MLSCPSMLQKWNFGLITFLVFLTSCQEVPITGRSQVNVFSDSEIRSMGDQSFSGFMALANKDKRILLASESPQAATTLATVRRVSDRIIDAAGLRGSYNWETIVVKAKEPNAFVTPNGKVVVFTGILSVARGEAGLAAVIGHEVGHVVARHGAERVSQVLLTQMALNMTDAALVAKNSRYRPAIGAALGLGAQYGLLLPFSREHESEADHIGLFYMAKAGYDPSEAIGLWERMEAAGGSGPWQFLSTHPSPSTRRMQIQQWLPEANLYYADRARLLPNNLAEVHKARAEQTSKMAFAPIASRPSYESGFWYQSKVSNRSNPVTYRFNRKEPCVVGECMVLETDGGENSVVSMDFALVEIRNTSNTWTKFSPPFRMIRWPLQVGDTWSETITIEQSTGRRQSAQSKVDVVSYETIAVPSGNYQAYKIIASLNGTRFREIWYAPETRTFVRTITYNSSGDQVVSELVDFKKGEGLEGTATLAQ